MLLPPPANLAVTTPATPPPSALTKLQETRESLLTVFVETFKPDHVREVLEALHRAAVGYERQVVDKQGNKHAVFTVPDVNAAKLYLLYAVGPASALAVPTNRMNTPNLTPEEFMRMAKIAARYGKKMKNVRADRDVVDVEAREVANEASKETDGSGTRPGTGGDQSALPPSQEA